MAKLFKSTLVFVVALVFVAEARPECKSGKGTNVDVSVSVSAEAPAASSGVVGITPLKIGGLAKPSGFGKLGLNLEAEEEKCCDKIEKFHFDKEKFLAFLHKVKCLFKIYASKELVPELKELLAKTATFVVETIAKEKPGELCRINKILQKSAKICQDACDENNCKPKC